MKLIATLAFALVATAAQAAPVLRSEVTVNHPVVTVGDMFDDAGAAAEEALFRAPLPGTSGLVGLADIDADTMPTQIGQLQLARFVNKSGLESMGDNLFLETAASGPGRRAQCRWHGRPDAGVPGNGQRQFRHRNRRPHRCSARLRDERPRHLGRGRDAAVDEPDALRS